MVEFYEAYADYKLIAERCEQLVAYVAAEVGYDGPLEFAPSVAPRDPAGGDPRAHRRRRPGPPRPRCAPGRDRRAQPGGPAEDTWGQLVDALLSRYVEPDLGQPTFLFDYPVELSPFAKAHRDVEGLVERFEAFAGGIEIANAFTELNAPMSSAPASRSRAAPGPPGTTKPTPTTRVSLRALEHGMPPTGGIGIGIDRLVMLLSGRSAIREVVLFPALREPEPDLASGPGGILGHARSANPNAHPCRPLGRIEEERLGTFASRERLRQRHDDHSETVSAGRKHQMFERFTERARQVVVLAQEEARTLKHNYIGTEHILLGLLREEEGLAARVLESWTSPSSGCAPRSCGIVGSGEEVTSADPVHPAAKKVLELALREALSLGHNYIGTEHILLGLVRENEGVAARILLDFDADSEKIRNEVIRMLSGPGSRRQGAGGAGTGAATGEGKKSSKLLDQFGRNLTKLAADAKLDPVVGRETEIERIMQILSRRTKNNPVLIGEPGRGQDRRGRGPGPAHHQRRRPRAAQGQADLHARPGRRWSPARSTAASSRSA
jgi:hypothetical protein